MNRSAQPGISSTVGGVSLDTSGVVTITDVTTFCRPQLRHDTLVYWSDLSPFEQGYTPGIFEAAARSRWPEICERYGVERALESWKPVFSDLAPETLAAIRKDCAAAHRQKPYITLTESDGGHFWRDRQKYTRNWFGPGFPPLTVTLGDDGKVRFASAASPESVPIQTLDAPNILPLQGVDRDHCPAGANLECDGGSAATEGQSQAEGGGDVG